MAPATTIGCELSSRFTETRSGLISRFCSATWLSAGGASLTRSVGGHFGPSYSIELENGSLTYGHSKPVQQFPPEWDSKSETIRPDRAPMAGFQGAAR